MMTRDEAVKKASEAYCSAKSHVEGVVAAIEALNLIKFDEPKTAEERAEEKAIVALSKRPMLRTGGGGRTHWEVPMTRNEADAVLASIKSAGLKIVEA